MLIQIGSDLSYYADFLSLFADASQSHLHKQGECHMTKMLECRGREIVKKPCGRGGNPVVFFKAWLGNHYEPVFLFARTDWI